MSTVKIVPFESGELIKANRTNPEKGYVRLSFKQSAGLGHFLVDKKPITMLMNGTFEGLQNLIKENPKLEFPGKLFVTEVIETEADEYIEKYCSKKLQGEERIKDVIKRAGKEEDAPDLTIGGFRILRFVDYDPTGTKIDHILQHENTAETKAYYHSKQATEATLPGTK